MTFGQRLKELRKARGMTQTELARKADISFTYVSKLETGAMSPPRQNIILALAQALEINEADTDKLFGLAGKIPPELLEHIDIQIIDILRSLKEGAQPPAQELAMLRRRIADLEASDADHMRLKDLPERHRDAFRVLVETSPDGIVILGSELEVIYGNASLSRIFGYEAGEFMEKDTFSIIHPDDMPSIASRLTKMLHNPEDIRSHGQCRVMHRDGSWRVVDVAANNLLNNLIVRGIVLVIHTIGGRSQYEPSGAERKTASTMVQKYRLTETEHKVLTLVADGKSNPQIAEQLMVSPCTVRFHVTGILRKLDVTSRTQAVAIAVRHHLVD